MTDARPPLWFIFTVTVSGILANTLLTPAIPDVLAEFGQPDGKAGILVASGPLPGVIIAPVIGVLADRLGRRKVLLPCLVWFGVAGLASSLAPTFNLLLVARFAQGIGGAGLINLGVVLIGDHWSGIERTKLIGRNSAVLTLCLALIPSLSGLITDVAGWRWSLALASVSIPVAIIGASVLPASRPAKVRTLGDQLRGAAEVIRTPIILAVVVAGFFLFVVIFGAFLTALPLHLEQEFGLGARERGLVLSSPAIGSTLAAFNLARVREVVSLRTVLVISGGLISVAALTIGVAPVLIMVVLASVFYGLGEGLMIPALQDVATSATPDSQRASVMAAWVASVRLGQAVGPLVFAAILAATTTGTAMVVGAVLFAGVAGFFALGPVDDDALEAAKSGGHL